MATIFTTKTTVGLGTWRKIGGDALQSTDGWYAVTVAGTFDGASATIVLSTDSGTTEFGLGADAVLTATGLRWVFAKPGMSVNVRLATVGASTSLTAEVTAFST